MAKSKALPKGLKINDVAGQVKGRLYHTEIVSLEGHFLVLRSGGWLTMHTKKCINLILAKYNLGLKVAQVKGQWLVSDRGGKVVPFVDGMEISI